MSSPPSFVCFVALREEMGNIGTAAAVYPALERYAPSAAFILGIAGTLGTDRAGMGDVVISSAAKFLGPDKVQTIDEAVVTFCDPTGAENLAGSDDKEAEDAVDESSAVVLEAMKRMGGESWLRFRRDVVEFNDSKSTIAAFIRDTSMARLKPVGSDTLPDADAFSRYGNAKPSITTGAILGSEWVVDSKEFVDFLIARDADTKLGWYARRGDPGDKDRNKWRNDHLMCLDMESYGFFRSLAAYSENKGGKRMHGFSVRGISDPCDNKKGLEKESKKAIRRIAVHNAIETLVDLIFYLVSKDFANQR